MAMALRGVVNGWDRVWEELKIFNLYKAMARYLQQYNVPFHFYYGGTGYEEFIRGHKAMGYTPQQLESVQALVQDPSFRADLMTLRDSKKQLLEYIGAMGFSAQAFLSYVEDYDPQTDFELTRMEIIGTGLPDGNWASGKAMHRVDPEDEMVWEIEQELAEGLVKFRADDEWVLDWGKGENDPNTLVFKGGNFLVSPGHYRIRINLRDNTAMFTPLSGRP